MRVELLENLRHRLLHEVGNVDGIDILVVDDVEKVVELVARRVDDAQRASGIVRREEATYQDSRHYAESDEHRHKGATRTLTRPLRVLWWNGRYVLCF